MSFALPASPKTWNRRLTTPTFVFRDQWSPP